MHTCVTHGLCRVEADIVMNVPGLGMLGLVAGHQVVVGSKRLALNMLDVNPNASPNLGAKAAAPASARTSFSTAASSSMPLGAASFSSASACCGGHHHGHHHAHHDHHAHAAAAALQQALAAAAQAAPARVRGRARAAQPPSFGADPFSTSDSAAPLPAPPPAAAVPAAAPSIVLSPPGPLGEGVLHLEPLQGSFATASKLDGDGSLQQQQLRARAWVEAQTEEWATQGASVSRGGGAAAAAF